MNGRKILLFFTITLLLTAPAHARFEAGTFRFGAGMGLPNMEKNSDEITVESEKSQGTRVKMVFYLDQGD